MNRSTYCRWVRLSALYDLLVTLPFALPGVATLVLEQLAQAHGALGLPGAVPAFAPAHLLFVHLLGSLVVVWAVLRLARPEPRLGLADGMARVLFASWQGAYLLSGQISPLVWGFFVPELAFALVQLLGYLRLSPAARVGQL